MTQNLEQGPSEARDSELTSSNTDGLIIGGSIVGGSITILVLIICCCCSVRSRKSSNAKVLKPVNKQTGGRMELGVAEEAVCKTVTDEAIKKGGSREAEAASELPEKKVRFSFEDDKKTTTNSSVVMMAAPVAKPTTNLPPYARIREGVTSLFYSIGTP
ncbi:unnamed protein product [Hydatigera taeniaeformis]|uniref:Uncharacterized protein n=1 Tax=Hydatigena taeniaeformis TaxID=6205 RepID=A0A0R3WZL8_HYDTA|nr:unnamed protein product [Hydatigera taeniaeformis]